MHVGRSLRRHSTHSGRMAMVSEREILSILGRKRRFFAHDLEAAENALTAQIRQSSFLVLGGAGSIGQAVVKALFRRRPARLHVVDTSENNLVELVRDIRSSYGYIDGDFRTLPLDISQPEFDGFVGTSPGYDFVVNLSALKHVRSEKDAFTLMRMLVVNVLSTESSIDQACAMGARRYFSVSSDKAANPANAMGATKRVMERCLARAAGRIEISSARFANVAFSDGSLLHGFHQRLAKRQPLAAPQDVERYFITGSEAADLCLMACLLGNNRETFYPNVTRDFEAMNFRTIAERFLRAQGYRAHPCETEEEARSQVEPLAAKGLWPCYFFTSDTTGEKQIEEFYMADEKVDVDRYSEIGVVCWPAVDKDPPLDRFLTAIRTMRANGRWTRDEILGQLTSLLPEFQHQETGKFLDSKM